jgi:hypothetical protein
VVSLYKNNNKLVIIFAAISFSFVLILMALFICQQQQQINLLNGKLTVNNQVLQTVTPALTPVATVAEVSPANKPSPTPTTKIYKAIILENTNWTLQNCDGFSFKFPPDYIANCTNTGAIIQKKGDTYFPPITISKNTYDGGSRRQYWINALGSESWAISKYMRFQETMFGTVSGLDVFASGGWWQSGYASPILIANEKTIVAIHGGRNFDDEANKIVRWDITDTIASTIKFL